MSAPLDASAVRASRASLGRHSKSFALAAKLLPREARDPVAVIYAWCRRCDDAVDEVPQDERAASLRQLQREVDAIYAGDAMHEPTLGAFQVVVTTYGIPRLYVDELLLGLAMDAGDVRYDTLEHLLLYCYRVAGVVGLMMCHVLGLADARLLDRAAHLGVAMQLTNICRDIAEDWGRGRRYVPAELLPAPAAHPAGPAPFPPSLGPLYAEPAKRLLLEAERYYASADTGIRVLGFRASLAIRLARSVYAAIGTVIARRGYDVTAGRAVVGRSRKLALLLRTLSGALLDLPRHLRRRALNPPSKTLRFEDAILSA
jgi:phytoene synthase